MPLLGPFDRPLPFRGEVTGRPKRRVDVPSMPPPSTESLRTGSERTAAFARFVTRVLIGDVEHVETSTHDLLAVLHPDVSVWSPSFYRCGRSSLIEALRERDDAVGRIDVHIGRQLADDRIAFTEWRMHGTFGRAGFVDDDVLVEPSHAPVGAAGVLVCEFERERVRTVRCYYDELGLIERLLASD